MKNVVQSTCIFLLLISVQPSFPLWAQQDQEHGKIVEEVSVVNVLVPVRVFHKGKPVEGLRKKDFKLYENGTLQTINTFQVFSRRIEQDSTAIAALRGKKRVSRFFVLIFNVLDFNPEVEKAIDLFFKNVYRETDRVVIITPERTFDINSSRAMLESMPVLKNILKVYSRRARNELNRVFRYLEKEVEQFFQAYFVDMATKTFLANYKRIWDEYSRKYLIPDVKKFQWFADVLKKVNMEKWVIVFQQREVFPQFKAQSRIEERIKEWITARPTSPTTPLLEQLLVKLKYSFKVGHNFPIEELKEAFFRANATFHVLLFRTLKGGALSQDFEYSEAVSDYEQSFRAISEATGGDVILTNKLSESLKQVARRKDVYYILSYAPREIHEKNRKIKVTAADPEGNRGLSTYYIRNLKLNPGVREEERKFNVDVAGFSFKNRQLKCHLVNYLQKQIEGKTIGVLEVRLMVMDKNTEDIVYNKSRILEAKDKRTKMQIRFNTLKKGEYHLILDVSDKLTNKTRIYTEEIIISP
jgi:hypothetical protein